MKKTYPTTRFLSWLLIAAMLCSFAVPIRAVGTDATALSFQQTDRAAVDGTLQESQVGDAPASPRPADTELVRVSIVLEEASTLEAGFDPENIAGNAGAMSYREKLQARQDQVAAQIQAVTGEALDIVWNLTLAANLISAQNKSPLCPVWKRSSWKPGTRPTWSPQTPPIRICPPPRK